MGNRILISLLAISSLAWAQDCVPSARRWRPPVTSPDGQYRVSNVYCSDQTQERAFALVLRNLKSGEHRILYTFNRDAIALWSPDSRWIAINDYAGSDYTNNVVVSIDRSTPSIDLKERLLQSKPKQSILKSDHLYLTASEWKSESEIDLLAFGHDSERKITFCRCFLMSLRGEIQQCSLPGGKDTEEYCVKIKMKTEKGRPAVEPNPDSAR
ncbi:MAG: hypothetical protein LAN83_10440 [Acidobacteriia bacterium]|nr:hypothetical protein [Terriglobia bacterium]